MANIGDDWRDGLKSTCDMNKYMLDHAINADCAFRVGPEDGEQTQVFRCNKTILSRYSPVFEAMFFGSMAEKAEEILIPDIKPDIFKLMLEYIYTEEFIFSNVQEASEVFFAADKYMLSLLKEEIADYLCHYVESSSVLQVLHTVVPVLKSEELKQACVHVLQQHTRVVINQKDFRLSPESTLLLILQQDTLSCEEYELVMAVERWAEHQVAVRKLPDNDVSIRTCLEPLIPHMRFLAMSKSEIESGPGQSNWLTQDEKTYINNMFSNNETPSSIETVISKEKRRQACKIIPSELKLSHQCFNNVVPYVDHYSKTEFGLIFSMNQTSNKVLLGLRMFSQTKSPTLLTNGHSADRYTENISITIVSLNISGSTLRCNEKVDFSEKHQIRDVPYNNVFDIIFNVPINIPAGYTYLLILDCNVNGTYPVNTNQYLQGDQCYVRYYLENRPHLVRASPITALMLAEPHQFAAHMQTI